jgi:hypothetical protein
MAKDITCTCGHSWNKSDSSKKDMKVCHICGKDNTMKDGGWLDKFQEGGLTDKYLGVKTNSKGKYVPPTNSGWTTSAAATAYNKAAMQTPTDIDANAMQALGQATSYPQRKIVEWITGTNQYPSEAMGIQNPYGAFAVDAVLDPTNVVGAGLLGKAAKASSKAANVTKAVKSAIKPNKQIISSTGNFFNELADKILPREIPVQQSIDAGNQWTKDWINHPATQSKVLNDFNMLFSPNNSTRQNYINHSLNYQPNSKLYPLSQQAKDLAQIIWKGKTSYGSKQMMHADNMGVSYRHHGNPLNDVTNSLLSPRYGTWISRNPKYSPKQIESTVVHENYHDWVREDPFVQSGQFHMIKNEINPDYVNLYDQWDKLRNQGKNPADVMGKADAYKAYLANPTEVHARIGELRKKYGIKPDTKVTAQDIQNMRTWENLPGNVVDRKFFDMFKNDRGASYLFNKLWAAPAAVGVGAAAMANQPEQKNGGWLDKYNDGGPVQPNYNDASVSMSKDFVGDGYSNVGRNYSPAWGGQFAMGGSMPGAVGFTYARTIGPPAPSNGKYAKKTKASAQDGKTIYSGMLPEITVVGSKDPQTEEYYRNMMDRLTKEEGSTYGIMQNNDIYSDPNPETLNMVFDNPFATKNILGRYQGLMDLGKKYGFPKVHPKDPNSVFSIASKLSEPDDFYLLGPRANYNPFTKTIQGESSGDWVSELAHHVQFKNNPISTGFKFLTNDVPAYISGKSPYETPGTMEHEAHSIIEPKLEEEIETSKRNYRQLPYIQKLTEQFYGPIENYQNGGEMRYYQEGLDFKPKTISKNGSKIIKDDRGQWAHPGKVTQIGSNQITMQGVPYPVLGISDTGDIQMMYPNQEYNYDGSSVTEYPMMAQGGQLTKLDQLTNFTNYNTKQPGGWLDKYQ